MRRATRLGAVAVLAALLLPLTSCGSGGDGARVFHAEFERAIQIFPAVKVRVLGVEVGHVTDIRNDADGVRVTFEITDPDIKLPQDVKAAVVPMSLLGERYIQLFPAYRSGPTLATGATIGLSRTAVPAEPDELLRSLQDYMSGLDSKTITSFVENAAKAVDGNGAALNRLIEHGTNVIATLSSKRQDLSDLIVELDDLTTTLSTRQQAIGQLIRGYNAVARILNENRGALEGTINGLNRASIELARLLIEHRRPLHEDIESLTRTGATLAANVEALAETGHWATRLFLAASRAVDYNHDWLRLGNQGQELGALILLRLEQRLIELCHDAGSPECATPQYWQANVPNLFCFEAVCPKTSVPPVPALTQAIKKQPAATDAVKTQVRATGKKNVRSLVRDLLDRTVGDPYRWMDK